MSGIFAQCSEENANTAEDITLADFNSAQFERLAGEVMSAHFGVELRPGRVAGVLKKFDFASNDQEIVGDAKYYTLVRGSGRPSAKFSTIAEHVWLLEKTRAGTKFLVFGNDRRVPEWWLSEYGTLAGAVNFFFLTNEGQLELLVQAGEMDSRSVSNGTDQS